MRDYSSALEVIAAALMIDPDDKSFPDDGLYKTQGQLYLYKGDILKAVKAFQESIVHHPFADVVPFNYLEATYEAVGWKHESEFVGKLKEKMRALVLTEEHRRLVHELCEACDRNSLEKSLWKVHDLKRACGSV
jgi:tetratricopeptide (TPR) repeat protein